MPASACGADGCLWVALYGGSAVHRYAPDGRLDATLSFPVTNITCPVFGGPGFGLLYVTSAGTVSTSGSWRPSRMLGRHSQPASVPGAARAEVR